MTISPRVSFALLTALLPVIAIAADVPNVSGIHAEQSNGKVTVTWNAVAGEVKKYRIFYSHASILEQGGVYDDYEDAPGTATSHTLSSVPPVATLYVSVLAVGMDDSESPFFMEEAKVDLAPAAPSVTSLPPSPPVAIDSSTLQLLTAISTSSTGVVLTFTHPLSIPEQFKSQAFVIKSGSGIALTVARYRLNGARAILDTGIQTPGRVYQVSVHGSVAGKTPSGELVPQEESSAPLLFTGLQTDLTVPDVQNLKLTAKGKNIEATWTPPAATIRELQLTQSTNGGRTFGTPTRLDKTAKGVTIPNVTAAQLTVLIRVIGTDGQLSRGEQQTITLGKTTSSSASSAKSSVASKPDTKPGTLPNSGLGLATVVMLSGAATGMRFFRRKNA